ncbi:MAG: glycosyltransferase family 39 protein [Chloroflexota bacterium]
MAIPFPSRRPLEVRALPLTVPLSVLDTALVTCLVLVGLGVRWQNLFSSPPFAGLGTSILSALEVAQGRAWPLADQAPYLGAPFVYLLAAVFRVFGPSLEGTMLLAWFIGALSIVPAYLLGKEIGGRMAGTVGAVLLATSPAHTIISSHVPWVHSLTPLLATLSLWLLARAAIRREGRTLLFAGLAIGITLQTHPTAFPLLAGAALATAIWIQAWRQIRHSVLFAACIVLGYSPLLLHHVQTQFQVVGDVQGKQSRYLDADSDPGERADQGVYANNLEQLAGSLVQLTSGEMMDNALSAGSYLRDPRLSIYAVLGGLGLVLGPRRYGWILLAGLIPAILLPPLLNGKYKPILDGRYLMPLVPVLFVGIGCALAQLWTKLRHPRLLPLAALVLMATLSGLTLNSLTRLDRYYEEAAEDGASNSLYLRTLATARGQQRPGETMLLDPRLREVKMPAGASAGSTFLWLLPVSGLPVLEMTAGTTPESLDGRLLLVHRVTANDLRQTVEVHYVDGFSPNGKDQPGYRLIRIGQG